MRAAWQISFGLALGALGSGCALEPEDGDPEQVARAGSTLLADNALGTNAMPENGLIANALAANQLAENALAANGVLANGAVANALARYDEAGALIRQFYYYAATCALDTGQSSTYWGGPAGWVTVYGQLGFAPEWASGPLVGASARLVSACMGARINIKGRSVTISIIRTFESPDYGWTRTEGIFWGNIFEGYPDMASCRGTYALYAAEAWDRYCTFQSCGVLNPTGWDCKALWGNHPPYEGVVVNVW